jgi:hypothetical protein
MTTTITEKQIHELLSKTEHYDLSKLFYKFLRTMTLHELVATLVVNDAVEQLEIILQLDADSEDIEQIAAFSRRHAQTDLRRFSYRDKRDDDDDEDSAEAAAAAAICARLDAYVAQQRIRLVMQ